MNVTRVVSSADLHLFVDLPYRLYRDDPMWVPPLRSEVLGQFDIRRNPFLEHCQYQLFLLWDDQQVVGRIAAFVDTLSVEYWHEPVGLFGYYECPDDPHAARQLLDTACHWLAQHGMTSMRGPWSFVSQEWGAVVEGYQPAPVVMSPYNPPFYNRHFLDYGMAKVKDLLVYYFDVREGYQIPERVLTLTDRVRDRYGIRVRPIIMKNLEQEVQTIIDLSNKTLYDNWGYAPVTEAEVRAMAHDLKPIIHPRGVVFAEDREGRPIGFAIAIPDVNQILRGLNGQLVPFGWAKMLWMLPRLTTYRMFALGVLPEYQAKGVDSLIYRALYEASYSPNLRVEVNYVLEDNAPMNNALLKLNVKPLRRYRIYQKPI